MSEEKGYKLDAGKDDWTLLPWEAVRDVVRVLTLNAQPLGKYPPDNWKKVPGARRRYEAALLRHAVDYLLGVRVDPDDGLPVIAHVITNASFLAWFDKHGEPADLTDPKTNPILDPAPETGNNLKWKVCVQGLEELESSFKKVGEALRIIQESVIHGGKGATLQPGVVIPVQEKGPELVLIKKGYCDNCHIGHCPHNLGTAVFDRRNPFKGPCPDWKEWEEEDQNGEG